MRKDGEVWKNEMEQQQGERILGYHKCASLRLSPIARQKMSKMSSCNFKFK